MSATILLVEDEENDIFFMKYALQEAGVANPLRVAKDGKEAMDYLGGTGLYADRIQYPLPVLMFLDIKLPHVMGLDVLKWMRGELELTKVIVIMLTSSELGPDIELAYQLGANAYLFKPANPAGLEKIAAGIKRFWLPAEDKPVLPEPPKEPVASGKLRMAPEPPIRGRTG